MTRKLKYNEMDIEYILYRTNKKSISIKVKEGSIYVYADMYSDIYWIEQFIIKNIEKILIQIEKTKINYKNGDKILIFGKEYNIFTNYTLENFGYIFEKDNLILNLPMEYKNKEISFEKFYRKILGEYLEKSFKKYTEMTKLYPKKVYIKKMTTRWGSCSSNKNISINLDLIKFEQNIIDYVVLHEICHLKEMNHSKEFWDLMEKYMPDCKKRRYILKN